MRPQCAFILRDAAKTPLLRMRESSELGADDHCRAHHITLLRHSGMRPLGAGPESILTIVVMDSGLALRAPRNDDADSARFLFASPRLRGEAGAQRPLGAGGRGLAARPRLLVGAVPPSP